VKAAYRASVHEATGYSPNMLMFGRENRLPVDLVLHGAVLPEQEQAFSVDEFVDNLCSKMSKASALVRESMGVAASTRKQRYDTGVKLRCFEPGQWVWYYYPRRRPQRSPKWQKLYTGPYLIVKMIDSHNAIIQRSQRSRSLVVHCDKLKPCLAETPPSWLQVATPTVELAGTQITSQKQSTPHKIERPHRTSHRDEPWDVADQGIVVERARRNVRLPKYLNDFVCSNSVTDNNRYCCLVQESQMTENSLQQCSRYCLPCRHMFVDQWAFNRHCQALSVAAYHQAFIEDPGRAAREYPTVAFRYSDQQTAQPTPVDCARVVASVSMVRRVPESTAGRSVSFPVADTLSSPPGRQRRLWRAHHMLTARHVATDIVSNPTLTTPSQVRDYLARNWRGLSHSELDVAASIAFAVSGATSAELSSILATIFDDESQSSSSSRLENIRATTARANAFHNF
jgi:hypothetical protein